MAKYRISFLNEENEKNIIREFEGDITFRKEYSTDPESKNKSSVTVLEEGITKTILENEKPLVIYVLDEMFKEHFENNDIVKCEIFSDVIDDYYTLIDNQIKYYSFQTLLLASKEEDEIVQYRISLYGDK